MHRRVQRPSEDRTVDRPEEVIQRWHALRHPRVHQFSLLALWWQLLGLECQRVNRRQECREPGIEIGSRLSLSSAPCVRPWNQAPSDTPARALAPEIAAVQIAVLIGHRVSSGSDDSASDRHPS